MEGFKLRLAPYCKNCEEADLYSNYVSTYIGSVPWYGCLVECKKKDACANAYRQIQKNQLPQNVIADSSDFFFKRNLIY